MKLKILAERRLVRLQFRLQENTATATAAIICCENDFPPLRTNEETR